MTGQMDADGFTRKDSRQDYSHSDPIGRALRVKNKSKQPVSGGMLSKIGV